MAKAFNVNIITPSGALYSGPVYSLILPAETGYLGILADHAPLITELAKGKIFLKDNSGVNQVFDIQKGGFLEVLDNNVIIALEQAS